MQISDAMALFRKLAGGKGAMSPEEFMNTFDRSSSRSVLGRTVADLAFLNVYLSKPHKKLSGRQTCIPRPRRSLQRLNARLLHILSNV
jgi:hypothetical protein